MASSSAPSQPLGSWSGVLLRIPPRSWALKWYMNLSLCKKKRASELRWGQRRFRRVMAGYRGFPRPKPDGREKPTKRVNILYRCTETGKAHYAPCRRSKKFELVDK